MQIEQLREQHDKLATRLEKAQAKARDLEVAAKVEAPRPEQATATTTGESATALELGAAKDMVKDLQSQLAAAARSRQASARAMAALRERVETLEADLASREAAYAKTTASLTAAVERTQRDERRAKRAATAAEQQAAEARAAVVRLEKMVDRLQSQLSMRTSTVAPKKQAAQQQSSIPVAIAEELEDLRANFEQSVELQVLYEQHLVKLGLDVERIRAEHFGSRESASEPVSAST
ncbi:hypothetical protein BC828DRAFT_392370 [Blastocladiella britannica]|nr:hypothetical protein BC828DRAFT_392370 [Blastocladiella britannica]